MNKKLLAVLLAVCLVAAVLSGCKDEMDISGDGSVTLGEYIGLEVYEAEVEVTDDDWQDTLDSIISSYTTSEEVTEGTVDEGDIVTIDYVGTINDGFEFDGGSSEDYQLELGSDTFIDGFEEGLYGAEIGSTVELDLTFPDDYTGTTEDEDGNEIELAGMDVVFTVTIDSKTEYNEPEFNDEFIQENFAYYGYSTAEEFEDYVREEMYVSNVIDIVWDDFIETCTVEEYDEDEIESYVTYLEEQYESQYESYYGVDTDTYLAAAGVDRDEFDESLLETAQDAMKEKMVYIAIAEAEDLVPTEEEYEEEAMVYVDANGYDSLEALEEDYSKDEVVYAVINTRVQYFIAENVTVLEGERPDDEDTEDEDSDTTDEDSDTSDEDADTTDDADTSDEDSDSTEETEEDSDDSDSEDSEEDEDSDSE